MMKKRFLAIAAMALCCLSLAFLPGEAFAQVISTFAGGGAGDGQPATKVPLFAAGIAFDGTGNLYIAGWTGVRKVDMTTGIINTVAGNGISSFLGTDGSLAITVPVSSSQTSNGIAIDRAGNLYLADEFNHHIRKIDATTGIVTTVAGTATGDFPDFSGDDGPATLANLAAPTDVVIDRSGNLYIADSGNHRVRKVVPGSDGIINGGDDEIITTVAGGCDPYSGSCLGDGGPATLATLDTPVGLAIDRSGNLYIAEREGFRVRKVDTTTGIISTVAGKGRCDFSGDGGLATEACLEGPVSITFDKVGNLYIGDTGSHCIRMMDLTTGVIITVAGVPGGGPPYPKDGDLATTVFIDPYGMAFGGDGNLYVASGGSRVVRIAAGANGSIDGAADETVTIVAGDSGNGFIGEGGLATDASFAGPEALAAGLGGNLYFAVNFNGQNRVFKVDAITRVITTIAGSEIPGAGPSGDGGIATAAHLRYVRDLAVDAAGNVFIAENGRYVRKIDAPTGIITTVAGNGDACWAAAYPCGDGDSATSARINPRDISVDKQGNLYIAEVYDGGRIRKVDAVTGIITTIAVLNFYFDDFAVDGSSNIFVSDYSNCRILKLSLSGIITTAAGNGICGFSGDGGSATQASISGAARIAVDEVRNLFINDGNRRIRKIEATTGIITTIAGGGELCHSLFDDPSCGDGGPATETGLPFGNVAVDGLGNVYVTGSDITSSNYLIRLISSLNQPPALRFPGNHTMMAGSQLSVPIVAFGPENSDSIVLSATNLPSSFTATFTDYGNKTGLLTLSPRIGQAGSFPQIRITATDSSGLVAERVITITVRNGDTRGVPAGNNVSVTSGTGVEVSFPSVSTGGSLSVTASLTGPTPPAGFQVSNPPLYPDPVFYGITTTLIPGTDFSGLVTVCINWQEGQFVPEDGLELLHYENGTWNPVTSIELDTTQNRICGQVSSFSPFLIAQRSNTPPVVAPAGGGRFELGSDIVLVGTISDLDGDLLSYRWLEGQTVLASGTISTTLGGAPISLPPVTLAGGLPLGLHTLTLEASDGINAPVSAQVTVEVIDTTAPTLNLLPNTTLLWPPNHQMVEVVIQTNARDNSGPSPTLAVRVASSEPPEVDGSGNTIPDVLITGVDQAAGLVYLQLRAERAGTGPGRIYTVTITATDAAGNSSTASVQVKAPHDRRAAR